MDEPSGPAFAGSNRVETGVVSNAFEPGFEGPIGIVGIQGPVHPEEGFLCGIVGIVVITGDRTGQAINSHTVAIHQILKRAHFSCRRPFGESFIPQFVQ
jgi:hypothetical protein